MISKRALSLTVTTILSLGITSFVVTIAPSPTQAVFERDPSEPRVPCAFDYMDWADQFADTDTAGSDVPAGTVDQQH